MQLSARVTEANNDTDPDAGAYPPCATRLESVKPQSRLSRGPITLCIVAIASLALILRTQHVSRVSFDFDEACSWKISQFPWDEMIEGVSHDAHPPLYYIFLKGLGALGVSSPPAIRASSVAFGVATVLAAFWFLWTALSSPQMRLSETERGLLALFAAALVATSALHVEMSLRARPYPLGTVLTLLAGTFLIRATRRVGTAKDWGAFIVSTTMLSMVHYYALFTVAALLLAAVLDVFFNYLRNGWNPEIRRSVFGLGVAAWGLQLVWVFWLPVFLFQRQRTTAQLWMGPLNWNEFCNNCWMALAGGQSVAVPAGCEWIAPSFWGGVVIALFVCGGSTGRVAAICAGLPVLETAGYCLAVRSIIGVKYLIFAQVFLLIATSLLIAKLRYSSLRVITAAGLLIWTGYWSWKHAEYRDDLVRFAGAEGAVKYLDRFRLPEEPVIVGSQFVHPIVQTYSAHPAAIYTNYGRNHRSDILGGPPLRLEDYANVSELLKHPPDHLWTIDVFDLFRQGSRFEASLPGDWKIVRQEEFREPFGIACVLAVREYRQVTNRSKPPEHDSNPAVE